MERKRACKGHLPSDTTSGGAKTRKERNPSKGYYPLEIAEGRMSQDIEGRCRARSIHGLGTAKEEISQESEQNQANEGCSPPGDRRGKDLPRHRKEAIK